MAATVGATLSGVTFALRHAGEGPYQSSGGNYYFFGRDSVNTGNVEPHKASDPMSAFTAQTAKTMSSATSTAIEAMACYQVGQVIHVVTQIATGQVFYNFYTMDTDSWGLVTSETAVAAAAFAPSANFTFVTLVVRSGGEVVIGYCAGLTAMASGFHMWRGIRRTGTNTYSALSANIDNGGSVNWAGGPSVLGASDRVHFFLQRNTSSGGVYQRTLSAANALETFPAALQSAGIALVTFLWAAQGSSYNSGATVLVPYDGTINGAAVFTSADAPSVANRSSGADGTPANVNTQIIHTSAYDSGTLHQLYSLAAGADLFHDTSINDATSWGADVNEFAATINRITTNIYTRSGTKYLAMVLDDAGTIKYAEITLSTPASLVFEPNRTLRLLTLR